MQEFVVPVQWASAGPGLTMFQGGLWKDIGLEEPLSTESSLGCSL